MQKTAERSEAVGNQRCFSFFGCVSFFFPRNKKERNAQNKINKNIQKAIVKIKYILPPQIKKMNPLIKNKLKYTNLINSVGLVKLTYFLIKYGLKTKTC